MLQYALLASRTRQALLPVSAALAGFVTICKEYAFFTNSEGCDV